MDIVDKVVADLQELRDDWSKPITENRLRNDSVKLRRFVADGEHDVNRSDLAQAWAQSGHSKPLAIDTLERQLGGNAFTSVTTKWASIGGANHNGVEISGMAYGGGNGRPIQMQYLSPKPVTITLGEFINGTVAVAMGHRISRAALVRYVANKLGGAHWDETRLAKYRQTPDYLALDGAMEGLEFAGHRPVMFELLAIGQHIVKSQDIATWIDQ